MEKYAVIVAGGQGTRMGSALPKQFLPLAGKPVLYHTIQAFISAFTDIHIILVLPAAHISYAQIVLQAFPERIDLTIVQGGETRYHSVQNGLKAVTEDSIVFVHDGVRPLVSPKLIQACYAQAMEKGSAIPVIPIADSMRLLSDEGSTVVNRQQLRIVQTPQTFLSAVLLPAFEQPYSEAFTDEATVVEAHGTKVDLIAGERHNIKITTPEDLVMAEALWQHIHHA